MAEVLTYLSLVILAGCTLAVMLGLVIVITVVCISIAEKIRKLMSKK